MNRHQPAAGAASGHAHRERRAARIVDALHARPIVLIGLMGAGKSSVGKRLAARLGIPFSDADTEIELAAKMSIKEIFESHGEAYFRDGERRVVARMLKEGCRVLATGGGAFMNEMTREAIANVGISVWLNAELDVLMRRVRRRGDRPLLQGADPEGTMRRLMDVRYPTYAEADITVTSGETSHEDVLEDVILALENYLGLKEDAA
ncbi:MAG: shikimate kinase [Beijerinckiaceae bacterium]|nr:shikimate kinase [Beijerinckiaceae bacterium]